MNPLAQSDRDTFAHDLLASLQTPEPPTVSDNQQEHPSQSENAQETSSQISQEEIRHGSFVHPLLKPTLRLLSDSSKVQLVFCPTIQHLRAYLSSLEYLPPSSLPNSSEHTFDLLTILNLIQLHRDTSDFSAQGFSRTFASIVDVAATTGLEVWIVEFQKPGDRETLVSWDEEVPLLNGTMSFGVDDRTWAGKMIKIRTVGSKWCTICE
ncbi:MAG: hypothetical protein M1834_001610 [Cirrosporium novae-zelandiae]|nr:MAG: hypothetical protein M1834_004127 [Cirrosporium novae-zelandiae]KAI9735594.1 MAG: hypothetical protein M1834_001610 [Cirrosporium novae-zelandiae]